MIKYKKSSGYFNGNTFDKIFSLEKSLQVEELSFSFNKDLSELYVYDNLNPTQSNQLDRFVDNWENADKFYLVTNPNEVDISNSIQTSSVGTFDEKYKVLSPVGSYVYSNSTSYSIDEFRIFSCQRNVLDWSLSKNLECAKFVLKKEKKLSEEIIQDFLVLVSGMSSEDAVSLLTKLSVIKSALDDGILSIAKYATENEATDDIFTVSMKNWLLSKFDSYYSRFPRD